MKGRINIDSLNIPLYEALVAYSKQKNVSFHMPGHKLGKGIPKGFYHNFLEFDLTEIPGLDNLHSAAGIIADAQRLAAIAFSADKSFFLVNGATSGIHAMIMTACNKGDKLIVVRDCHKSVINAMILAGVAPVYLIPEYNSAFGISEVICPEAVEKAFEENPDAIGLFLTRPSYYGICADLKELERIVHSRNKLLLVDEAHGSHLSFNNRLPESAMQLNADICVQSAHKTLPAITQGAYLHVKGDRADTDKLQYYLRLFLTTSPSYIIMSSLDIARAIIEAKGNELLNELLDTVADAKLSLKKSTHFKVLEQSALSKCQYDNTRVVVNAGRYKITGYELEQLLRYKYGIQVEMSDLYNIVLITTISDDKSDFLKFVTSMESIGASLKENESHNEIFLPVFNIPYKGIDLSDTINKKIVKVNLLNATERISGQMVVPYPPGIPVICPGEIFSHEIIDHISLIKNSGGIVHGLDENMYVDVLDL